MARMVTTRSWQRRVVAFDQPSRRLIALVAPLRAGPLGQHALEIGGLVGAAEMLLRLVRSDRGVDRLVLLGDPLLLRLAQLLGCRFALGDGAQITLARQGFAALSYRGS